MQGKQGISHRQTTVNLVVAVSVSDTMHVQLKKINNLTQCSLIPNSQN